MRKTVRFYELRCALAAEPGVLIPYDGDYWGDLGIKIAALQPEDRQVGIRGRQVFGQHRRCVQPATDYYYVGRVRPRAEWPDTLVEATGNVGHLEVRDHDAVLLEPTYVVPFGNTNQIALLTMSMSSPRVSMVESWFTAMVGENTLIDHYSLLPILNFRVQQRLSEANGATIFRMKSQPGARVPTGGGRIGTAARRAAEVSSETAFELGWTLGHRTGSQDTTSELLEAARWIRSDWVDSAEVSLQLPDGEDGIKRRTYDLIKEQFTSWQNFDVLNTESPSEQSVLTGITDAIAEFRREFG